MDKKKKIDSDEFLTSYMSFVEKNKRRPKNFEAFLKKHQLSHEGKRSEIKSFKELDRHIFYLFHLKTLALLEQSEDYLNFSTQNKLLSFYYTFFDLLSANKGYVKVCLRKDSLLFSNQLLLKNFKPAFLQFIDHLPIETIDLFDKSLNKLQEQLLQSAAWLQFMSLLNFWLNDGSTAYEKTDIFIEKLVNTGFDLINIKPILSVVDLGKFILNEKINKKK